MLIPQVVGFRLEGELPEGATATDLVLRVTEILREKGVVGKFVEFYGPGLASLPLADRATIANMSPEYGATCGIFPVDRVALDYLAFSGRSPEQVALAEAYMKEQGMFHTPDSPDAEYSDTLELELDIVEPSLAGPKRPQDRISLGRMKAAFEEDFEKYYGRPPAEPQYDDKKRRGGAAVAEVGTAVATIDGQECTLRDGSVVIAAITSCTNTSNPSVMLAAGLVAKKAVERGLQTKPWVKTSLAPGSLVVTDYLMEAGLLQYLERLGFHLVGYGCTTCIGNSGPLPEPVAEAVTEGDIVAAAVLSGNRNFEGRVHPQVRANFLASPPLVVAYALAGRVDIELHKDSLGTDAEGYPVYLSDIWPTREEIEQVVRGSVRSDMFENNYREVFTGDDRWQGLEVPTGATFDWEPDSTYVRQSPFFQNLSKEPSAPQDIQGARVLALLGDSITTDHISPAGSIKADSPAGKYLQAKGVDPQDFNSYGSRRGNHEVMMRGTFANIRLRNQLVPGVEGGYTIHQPDGEQMSIYDAGMKYIEEGTPTIILAGKEYGSGSSRDWAAKGPRLQGVHAVIAESYERIHRSNLVGMGICPLQFKSGETAESLGLTGKEVYSIAGIASGVAAEFKNSREVKVTASGEDGKKIEFNAVVRIDTPKEIEYYRHGGILQYVLRKLLAG